MKIRGFSIVEVVILIAILGILLSIGVLSTNQLLISGRDEERKADAQTITTNLESFYASGITNVGSTQSITNMVPNPSVEVDTSYFTPMTAATVSRSSAWSADGTYSLAVTPNSASSNDSFVAVDGSTGAMRLGMQAGNTYTLQAVLYIPAPLTGSILTARAACITAWWYTTSHIMEKSCGNPQQAGIYHLSLSFTLPSDATHSPLQWSIRRWWRGIL
ncbi:MAG TPA: hypothetical protein PLY16_02100 [Candidatus Saccharibacteria bacterium]|nr:hypothetical protein [Candidatus Saccharibacteria bacterium]